MKDYRDLATQKAKQRGLDPDFVHRLITQESGWNPAALSKAGARGLMQLMPATAAGLGFTDIKALFDPATSIDAGTAYLHQLQQRYAGDPDQQFKMAAAYNAGPGRVSRNKPFSAIFAGLPAETRNYVRKVTGYQ